MNLTHSTQHFSGLSSLACIIARNFQVTLFLCVFDISLFSKNIFINYGDM